MTEDIDDDVLVPTKAELLAATLEGRASGGPVRLQAVVTTFRLSPLLLARIDAIAEEMGKSRTYTATELLEIGIEALQEQLAQKTRRRIDKTVNKKAQELMQSEHAEDMELN